MEHIHIMYFVQIFMVIPIMLTYTVSQYYRIPINNYSIEELILFGYFIILYCGRHPELIRETTPNRIEFMY